MIKMTLNSGWDNDRDLLYTASCFTNFIFLSITEIFAIRIEISSGLVAHMIQTNFGEKFLSI